MKRLIFLFVVAVSTAAVCCGTSHARTNPQRTEAPPSLHQTRGATHAAAVSDSFFTDLHIGALWFPNISNKSYIGYWDLSAYYPGGGNQSSLWQGGMWGGGYVQGRSNAWRYLGSDGSDADPAQYDTRDEQAVVETEADFGYTYPYRRLTVHVNSELKPYLESGADTVDGDMGMDVKHEWHQWGVQGFDNWVIVHVTIAFSKAIDDFYWGWMSDCDVGDVNLADVYFDDYAGWNDTYKFAYMRDWDYDPLPGQPQQTLTADSLWLSPGVIGQVLLAAPPVNGPVDAAPDPAQDWVSKNYWDWNNDVSSVQNTYDRLTGAWENPFPPEDAFDYRILNGVGPYQVAAGDTAHFWMAYVMGEGYDSDDYSIFGMGNLVQHVQDVQDFYDGGFVIPADAIPPQAPDLNPDLAADVSADELTVHWAPYSSIPGGTDADSFIVYTSSISKLGPWARYDAFDNTVTETIVKLVPGFFTYVWVLAYNGAGDIGSNPYALSSRLYAVDESGILRANENTITSVVGNTAVESKLSKVTVAPNPYVGSNEAELEEFGTLLGFHHLPEKCDIYIYNLLGNLVDIIHHDSATGSEFWDMTTRSQESISSGIYIYRVTTDDGDEKTGKFAVLKGQR
ncbi:MAG: T9SS type A sorting domain-containing protein [Candidatus Eisenbacteria bacterium]|nr:T9SS type A sorting domain-containing protein [Candidatus Eisenbacteria bacterium]